MNISSYIHMKNSQSLLIDLTVFNKYEAYAIHLLKSTKGLG